MIAEPVQEARAALERIAAAERADPSLDPRNTTTWFLPDRVADAAVLLLHGFTNGPLQYAELAPQLAARGHAVIIPRFPYHGHRDRLTTEIAAMRAEDWETTVLDAVAIAARCGRRVVVVGISVTGTLAGWLAPRVAIDHAIAIAPFTGIRELAGPLNDPFGALLRRLPNRFLWWDPRRKTGQPPEHGYPRFSTRALGQTLALTAGIAAPVAQAPHARRVSVVLNDCEPIVNNAHAWRQFERLRETAIEVVRVPIRVAHTHDVIEPQIPQARPDIVYPRLIELIEAG